MSKWNETGILRKKQMKDNYDDLLVFGYACKLFRDDDKALYIDQGKHLIPWMGDEKLKIDRYDGRGALSDLSPCEASKEGYDATRWLGLSDSERKIEQLCDEERFYSLHTNEDEEAMYKEEEIKRQQANEFQYSYDVMQDPEHDSQDSMQTCEEEVKPFVPPTELDVPVDISIPKTLKENARIEKTAVFVSKQGPQMEILIKAKQSENPQFNFMNQNDALYKYYRHVLAAIKAGRYKPQMENDEKQEGSKDGEVTAEDDYLHPSLAQAQAPPSVNVAPRFPTIPYKPAADCAYTQLISRIQGSNSHHDSNTPPPPPQEPLKTEAMTPEQQQQYYQYYYSMQYYEYYKQIAQQYAAQAGCDPQSILQNPQLQEQIQSQASHYAQIACTQYSQSSSNPYAQIVTNLAPNIKVAETPPEIKEVKRASPPRNPLLSLVHYSSDSDEEDDEDIKVTFKIPPDETAIIIDKMANYVSKNGDDFENIVRSKGDPRFEFLNDHHEYFKYYKHKLQEYQKLENKMENVKDKPKEKKIITPVCFSIKKTKEDASKEIKSALPVEESDEENEENLPAAEIKPAIVALPPPIVATQIELSSNKEKIEDKAETPEKVEGNNGSFLDVDDPILEMIDLTDDLEEKRDTKRAEDKIKDKLALAVKEKISGKSKDRALQMERRKRAAMFLKLKSGEGNKTHSRSSSKTNEESEEECSKREERILAKKGKEEILKIDDSESEEGEIKNVRRSSNGKKKKSHKRKSSRSRSRHDSKSHHKRSKKRRRRRSSSASSNS